jgi:uncharacterized protein YjdB
MNSPLRQPWHFAHVALAVAAFGIGSCTSSEPTTPAPTVDGVAVTPASASVAVGLNRQFTAIAHYSDGSSAPLTQEATWQSRAPAIATVSDGLVTGVSAGTAEIVATLGSYSDSGQVTVTETLPTLSGVVVSPAQLTLGVGDTRQLIATATYSDGSSAVVTALSTWTSTAPAIATVSGGLVAGVSAGNAGIVAGYSSHSDTSNASVTVSPPSLSGLVVTPAVASLAAGNSLQLLATAEYSDGSSAAVTGQSNWSSTAPAVATVSGGLVTGVSAGATSIIATFDAFSDTTEVTVSSQQSGGYSYPLKAGPTKRYLVDQNAKPFLMVGDAAWSLVAQLSMQDAETYLTSRQQNGFDLVMVNLIEHKFATNAPSNVHGISPFTGAPFSTPNEPYFALADSMIRKAAELGIVVLLDPAYLGNACGDEGWCSEIENASIGDLVAWGSYVGARYRDFDNIVWLIGGDTDPIANGVKDRLQAIVTGIQQSDDRHLFTAHNAPEEMAISPWSGASWLQINNVYTYSSSLYSADLAAFNVSPAIPFFLVESAYENESRNPSASVLRAQAYWTVLSGGVGSIFGNCPVWNFGAPSASAFCPSSDWKAELSSPGTLNMKYFRRLFINRHWQLLVPDESHQVLTSGSGSGGTYAAAAVTSDGSSIIVYLPSSRTITVSGASLASATMSGWWYNPATGSSTSIGSYPTGTPAVLTPPASGDWVLVLDNPSFGFPAP